MSSFGDTTNVYSPDRLVYTGQVRRYLSNNQFFMSLGQLPAQRNRAIAKGLQHVGQRLDDPVRGLVQNQQPAFGRQTSEPSFSVR